MTGVAACAWPAFVASSHPGTHCRQCLLFRPRIPCSAIRLRAHGSPSRTKQNAQVLRAQGRVRAQPAQNQHTASSNRAMVNSTLIVSDDPQGSIADLADSSAALHPSSSQVPVSTASTYTKADRANLASVPESEMTPEMLRRWRISKANKGKQPWNKGRQHPPETLAKIRERTKAAMMRPEVLARVRANHPAAPHTPQSKAKIGAAVSATFSQKRELRLAQQALHPQVSDGQEAASSSVTTSHSQGSAASPSRVSKRSKPRQKAVKKVLIVKSVDPELGSESGARTSSGKPAGSSGKRFDGDSVDDKRVMAEQHRKNISSAIKEKWADPEYRMRVSCGMKDGIVQHKRVSTARERTAEKSRGARAQLEAAKNRRDKLQEARQTVQELQSALQAGQAQAEALRGDPQGFARQQDVLNGAHELVMRAEAQVAELEANTPSLEQVAAELGAKSVKGNDVLTAEEQEITATSFVDEVEDTESSSYGQQSPFRALPSGIHHTHAVRNDTVGQKQSSSADVYTRHSNETDDTFDQLRHNYRHGRLQHHGDAGKDNSTMDGAQKLQPV